MTPERQKQAYADLLEINDRFEIQTEHGTWLAVAEYIFRSCTGQRRMNGEPYGGLVYLLGTDTVSQVTGRS